MQTVGRLLGDLLLSSQDKAALDKARAQIRAILMDKPLFSDEWLARNINLTDGYGQKDLNITQEVEAEKEQSQAERMMCFWDN